jgi:DNA-binding response OmpR family regulator
MISANKDSEKHIPISDNTYLNLNLHAIIVDNDLVFLPRKEFELLVYLIRNRGKAVTTEELICNIWDGFADINIVSQYIHKVRKKLNDKDKKIICHKSGVGYFIL